MAASALTANPKSPLRKEGLTKLPDILRESQKHWGQMATSRLHVYWEDNKIRKKIMYLIYSFKKKITLYIMLYIIILNEIDYQISKLSFSNWNPFLLGFESLCFLCVLGEEGVCVCMHVAVRSQHLLSDSVRATWCVKCLVTEQGLTDSG